MEMQRKRGFRTGQDVIRGYLNGLISFAKSQAHLYEQALVEIQRPMGPTAFELLSYIRPREVITEGEIEIPNIFEVDVFQKYDLLYLSQME